MPAEYSLPQPAVATLEIFYALVMFVENLTEF
jgi:hypothetical protein